jgi:hypothetical protein
MARVSWLMVFPTTIVSGFSRLFYPFRGFGTASIDKNNLHKRERRRGKVTIDEIIRQMREGIAKGI